MTVTNLETGEVIERVDWLASGFFKRNAIFAFLFVEMPTAIKIGADDIRIQVDADKREAI